MWITTWQDLAVARLRCLLKSLMQESLYLGWDKAHTCTHKHLYRLKPMSSKLGSWLSAPIKPKQAEAEILHAMLITLEIKQALVLFGYKIEMSYGTTRSEE